ncbi:MAG: hypothetical protein IJ106_10540 [Parasporobacterium sp.]|nr:hypothetical protein [Parasporobacterium sp.]
MGKAITLNNDIYWDISSLHGMADITTAAWTAEQNPGSMQNVTEEVILPKGTYMVDGSYPIADSDLTTTLRAVRGSTTLGTNHYIMGGTYAQIHEVFQVTSDEATVVLRSAQSNATSQAVFSYIERGYISFIRLA